MTTDNPNLEQLIDLVEGRLPAGDARRVVAEIECNPELRAAHEWLTGFVSLAEHTTFAAPPPSTRSMLTGLLPRPHRLDDACERVIHYVGRLVRDVQAGAAFAGARGAVSDSKRQLLFDAGDGSDVMVQLHIEPNAVHISGQVLADDPARGVRLVGDESWVEMTTDQFGEFSTSLPVVTCLQLELIGQTHHSTLDLTPFLDSVRASIHVAT